MQWLIGSLALVASIILAFSYAQSRRALLATAAVIAILAIAATALLLLEGKRDTERDRLARGLIKPQEVSITDATFANEFGNWRLRGTLVNHSAHRVGGLTVRVTVEDCPAPVPCKKIGENVTSTVGLDIAPQATQRIGLIVSLPDMPTPRAIKWAYEITEVRLGRE